MENPQTTMPPVPREPIIDQRGQMSNQWLRWIQQLQRVLSFAGGLAWGIVNKAGSLLTDIETRYHSMLQRVYGADPTNTGIVIEDVFHSKHVSDGQSKRWEDGASAAFQAEADLLMLAVPQHRETRPSYEGLAIMGGM